MKKSIFYEHIIEAAKQENTTVSEMAKYAASLGYSGSDVPWSSAESFYNIFDVLRDAGIKIACTHRFWDIFSPLDTADADNFFKTLANHGCFTAMIIPSRAENKPFTEEDFSTVCEALRRLCDMAKNYGIIVTVEDFDGNDIIINNTQALKKAFDAVPQLCHSFDTGNYAFFQESEIEAFALFKDRIKHVHLKDRAFRTQSNEAAGQRLSNGTTSYPCAVGKGDLKIRECLRLLAEMGYDGYFSVEHFGHPKMKDAIRDSAKFLDHAVGGELHR
jgi:inosose dehydratase